MITYVACDLFLSPARVLVNTVNTVGVMGKGIAKRFKQVYPDMFERYQQLCEEDAFGIGELWLYKTPNKWVPELPHQAPLETAVTDRGYRAGSEEVR